jgi:hypothetical protein
MMRVSALYVRRDSIYKRLGVDCWDVDRDARRWPGGHPVIAHPPCRSWGNLRHMAKPQPGERELAIHAIQVIRKYGGVLEHPRGSMLWEFLNLPLPGFIDDYGGFSILINQSWFGHKAEKKTLLYINGCKPSDLPSIPIRFDAIEFTVSSKIKKKSGRRIKREITKKEREETPVDLAKWLIEVATKCNPIKQL